MGKGRLVDAFLLSACLHLSVLLAVQVTVPLRERVGSSAAPIVVEMVVGGFGGEAEMSVDTLPPPVAESVAPPPAVVPAAPDPPAPEPVVVARAEPGPPPPVEPEPVAKPRPEPIAKPEPVARKRFVDPEPAREPIVEAPPLPAEPRVSPWASAEQAKRLTATKRTVTTTTRTPTTTTRVVTTTVDEPTRAGAGAPTGSVSSSRPRSRGLLSGFFAWFGGRDEKEAAPAPRVAAGNGFRPDTPGYEGRIFGQISVRGSNGHDAHYGRVHLFAEHESERDYTPASLFGYSFRQQLPGGGVRDVQVGRVQTPGAYLIVTDLFPNGRISSMSHTVVLAFPRRAPEGGDLYEVADASGGDFRLRGPNGSALVFDGRNHGLRGSSGFRLASQGPTGTPPRVSWDGLYVRIHAVGGSPFAQGRSATVVDRRGRSCPVSTSELFVYEGRRESDVFRFPTDEGFYAFLDRRCPYLDVPGGRDEPETLLASGSGTTLSPEAASTSSSSAAMSRGLIPALIRGFGR